MSKRQFYVGLSLVLALAIFLRFFKLGEVPVSLYWDETAILLDAKVLSQSGKDIHGNNWFQVLFPSYGDFKLPAYIWLATLSVKLMGVNEMAVRLPSALAGLGTILMSGLIAREFFSKLSLRKKRLVQLSTMIVVAISPWSIMFSRTAFEGHLGQFILAFSIWLVFKAKNKEWLILTSPLLGALATYTYFSVRFVWPVIFIATSFLVLKNKVWKWLIPTLLIFSILLIPMIKSPLYEESNNFRYSTTSVLNAYDYPVESNKYRDLAGMRFIDRAIFHRHWLMINELLRNYSDNLSFEYLFISGDKNLRHGTGEHGLFLLIFLPIFLAGVVDLFRKQRWELLILLLWWLVALLPASVPEDTPHALRSLNALVPLGVIIGYGLSTFYQYNNKAIKCLLSLIVFLSIGGFTHQYFTQYPSDSAYDWQDGYKEMSLVINKNLPNVADVYIDQFDDRFYLWLLAYGDQSAVEIQSLKKEKYLVKKMEKITFEEFHWHKIDSLDRKILVVGLKDSINLGLEQYKITPSWEKEIYQANGKDPFKVVMLERQNK